MSGVALFLDIDDTVSPIPAPCGAVISDTVTLRLAGWDCVFYPHVLEFLGSIPDHVIVSWISSWGDLTQYIHEDSSGMIPDWKWLVPEDAEKHVKVRGFLNNHPEVDRVIVADDDEYVIRSVEQMVTEEFPGVEVLSVCPRMGVGMTADECGLILSWMS